jgi:hypothetical protein
MRVTVRLQRDCGRYRPSLGPQRACVGDLHLTYRTSQNRKIAVLQLLGAERTFPNVYDPKLVDFGRNTLRFIGYEPIDGAWVTQEWHCDLS